MLSAVLARDYSSSGRCAIECNIRLCLIATPRTIPPLRTRITFLQVGALRVMSIVHAVIVEPKVPAVRASGRYLFLKCNALSMFIEKVRGPATIQL